MLSAKPITSTLPITISENATIDEVAALLRAHREEIEEFSKSPRRRRELAVTRNIGLQALTWLQQLEGLDEQHVLPKQPCLDLGWLLVAEGNERAMISWLVEESSHVRSSQDRVKPSRANYHDVGVIGNRIRRRHDQLGGLIDGHVALGNVDDAIRCLRVTVRGIDQVGGRPTIGLAGAMNALESALLSDKATPGSVSEFESLLEFISSFIPSEMLYGKIAWAKLYHPAAPDPWAAYSDMGRFMAKANQAKHKIKGPRWDKFGWFYIRTMFILHLQGAVAESDAVSEVLQEHFARVWRKRHPQFARLKKDPKLQKLLAQYRNAVREGRRQGPSLESRFDEPKEDGADIKAIDDILAEPEPELEDSQLLFRQDCWNYDRSGEDDSGASQHAKMCLHFPRPHETATTEE
jgi:hypothetical protein